MSERRETVKVYDFEVVDTTNGAHSTYRGTCGAQDAPAAVRKIMQYAWEQKWNLGDSCRVSVTPHVATVS